MKITTEEAVYIKSGKQLFIKTTRYYGRSKYAENILADECHEYDYGDREGTTKVYILYPQDETKANHKKCVFELKKLGGDAILTSYKG